MIEILIKIINLVVSIGLLKENSDIDILILTIFTNELKVADITPTFKSVDSTAKKYQRPISILNSISKIFEKLIQSQLSPFFFCKLNENPCGY